MNRPKAAIFDLGMTILNLGKFDVARGARKIFELARKPDGITFEIVHEHASRLQADWHDRVVNSLLEYSFQTFQRNIDERLGLAYDLSPDEVEWAFWDATFAMHPEPGIVRLLDRLRALDVKCAIMSNSIFAEPTLRRELARHGLEDRFEFIMSSCDYGMMKPHPELFLTAIGKLGEDPADIWFLGDSRRNDVGGSQAVGIVPFWYSANGDEPAPQGLSPFTEVRTWEEMLGILDRVD